MKYRLAVSGRTGSRVALAAHGLPSGWIGSFCSDRFCAPFRSTVVVPAEGVKIVEFQVVPAERVAARPVVRIDAAADGKPLPPVSTVVSVQ